MALGVFSLKSPSTFSATIELQLHAIFYTPSVKRLLGCVPKVKEGAENSSAVTGCVRKVKEGAENSSAVTGCVQKFKEGAVKSPAVTGCVRKVIESTLKSSAVTGCVHKYIEWLVEKKKAVTKSSQPPRFTILKI